MAITPLTGFKALTFDGEKSTDYGVAILGEGVFNAPERDVEMITIPGRSGQFAMDNGRFENIEVTYPANLIANNEADFAEALSDFRNMLCSKRGYVRLQDDYHPDEYRMAVYKEGLDVDAKVLKAGEFKLKFDCKPQRWLKAGETAVTMASGDTLTNPTLFESSPLLEVEGYGTIEFNGHKIQVEQKPVGDIVLSDSKNFSVAIPYGRPDPPQINLNNAINVDTSVLNSGDSITLVGARIEWAFNVKPAYTFDYVTLLSETGIPANTTIYVKDNQSLITTSFSPLSFQFGTASTQSHTTGWSYKYSNSLGESSGGTTHRDISIAYDGAQTFTISVEGDLPSGTKTETITFTESEIDAFSSVVVTDPVFIDCETGEAYWAINNTIVDGNSFVVLGSELPTLASGSNTVTFDNTFSSAKITPRWWKV